MNPMSPPYSRFPRNYLRIFLCRFLPIALVTVAGAGMPSLKIGQYVHQSWRLEEGLPQNTLTSLAQTPDGYLWLGSRGGLIRFNGTQFKLVDSRRVPVLTNDYIWTTLADSRGNLWAGTDGGGLIRYGNRSYTVFTSADGLPENVIWSLYEDSEGTLWIGSAGGGLSAFRDGKFTSYFLEFSYESNLIWTIAQDARGNLLLGTDGGGLILREGDKFRLHPLNDRLDLSYVFDILTDSRGALWLGTGNGLFCVTDSTIRHWNSLSGLGGDIVWDLLEDHTGTIWIGLEDGGLSCYRAGRIENFREKDGLYSNSVAALLEDLEGNIWVGTKGGGLHRFSLGSVRTLTKRDGLGSAVVNAAYESRDGSLWFGTQNGGVTRLHGDQVRTYTTADGLPHNIVLSIAEDRSGVLWFGTDGGGLGRLQNSRLTTLTTKQGLSHDIVWTIAEDRHGQLWFGTDGGGLNRYAGGKFITLGPANSGLTGEFISAIIVDRHDDLWIGTRDAGLFHYRNYEFIHYATREGLYSDVIWSLYEDQEGYIWIGTNAGLNRWRDGRMAAYNEQVGLCSNVIYGIIEDDGWLWMSSNKGIFRISRETFQRFDRGEISRLEYDLFNVADGMKSSECSPGSPSIWKTREGWLLVPTLHGVALLDPRHLIVNERIPPVYIEEIRINGRRIDPALKDPIPQGEGKLEIHYAALSYRAPGQVRYRYMLRGVDRTWVEAGNRNRAYYTNTPPGKHHFRVQAANNDGVWNEVGASLEFRLLPPFYRTLWFYGAVILLTVGLAAGSVRLRLQRLKRNEEKLERRIRERTAALNQEIRERQQVEAELRTSEQKYRLLSEELQRTNSLKDLLLDLITHDIRNPAGVASGMAEVLAAQLPGREELQVIQSSVNKLLKVIEEATDLAKLSVGDQLDKQELDLNLLLEEVVNDFRRLAGNAHMTLELRPAPGPVLVQANPIITSVFRNYISNGIKYAALGKRLIVDLQVTEGWANVSVLDFGDRIPEEQRGTIFKRGVRLDQGRRQGRGLGLAIVERIAKAHAAEAGVRPYPAGGNDFYFRMWCKVD